MTQAQHTPGPWAFTADMYGLDNMRVFGVNDATGNGIANCGYDGRGECKANARLIAAAPDLLAALDRVDAYLSPFDGEEDAYAEIRSAIQQAIAKAKGE